MLLNNKHIKQIVDIVMSPKSSDEDPLFAIQLFIEELVLPDNCKSYSHDELLNYIKDFLFIAGVNYESKD